MANTKPHHLEGMRPDKSADRQTMRWLAEHDPKHDAQMREDRAIRQNERKLHAPRGKIRASIDNPMLPRRVLVKQGCALVIHDLGGLTAVDGVDDTELAHRHQQRFLGTTLKVQFHTWFKVVAQRAHNGWNQAHTRKLSNSAHLARLSKLGGMV